MSFHEYLLFNCDFRILNVILENYETFRKAWKDWHWAQLKNLNEHNLEERKEEEDEQQSKATKLLKPANWNENSEAWEKDPEASIQS